MMKKIMGRVFYGSFSHFAMAWLLICSISSCTQKPAALSGKDDETIEQFQLAVENELGSQYPDSVLNLALRVVGISSKIKNPDIILQALNVAAANFNISGNPDSAIFYAQKLSERAKQADDDINLARAHNILGLAHLQKHNNEKARVHLLKAIEISGSIGKASDIAYYYQSLGNLYSQTARYDSAIYFYQIAAQNFTDGDDEKSAARTFGNIGSIHIRLNNYKEAVHYFRKSIAINTKAENYKSLAHNYNNLGVVFKELGRYDQAKMYYDSAVKINEITGNKPMMMAAKFNYANILRIEGSHKQALDIYFDILQQAEEINLGIGIFNSKSAIGETYLDLEKYENAINYLQEAINFSESNNITNDYTDILLNLARAQIGLHAQDNAINTLQRYEANLDSLNFQSQQKIVSDLEARYQVKEKDNRLAYMSRINQSKTRLNYLLTGLIILAVLLFVIIILFYRSNVKNLALRNDRIEKENALKKLELEKSAIQSKLMKEEAEKLSQSIKIKEEISRMIVHDLKNPLNNIINNSRDIPASQKEKLQQTGKKMLHMVLNILDVYKYESAQIPVKPTKIDLIKISSEAVNEIKNQVEEKNIKLKNLLKPGVLVKADEELIGRVLVNVLSNAVRFAPLNGLITLTCHRDKEIEKHIRIEISDNGPGIPLEYQKKVFEKFPGINNEGTDHNRSTGLGLTFCKMAVEAHGGSIGVDPDYHDGARIFFTLPGAFVNSERIAKPEVPKNLAVLSPEEKSHLQDYLAELERLEIYEVTALRKLARKIENETDVNNAWIDNLKKAINFGNEKQLMHLVRQIKA